MTELSRRDFIKFAAFVAGSSVLAACSPSITGPILRSPNKENEILGSEIPQNSNMDYVGQITNSQGQNYGFYRVEQQNNLQEQASVLFELIATESDRAVYENNPMSFFTDNFMPNFENPNSYIDSRPFEQVQENPNVVYTKRGDNLGQHCADGLEEDEKLKKTPDHSALAWFLLAGTITAVGVGSKLTQVGLQQLPNGAHSLVYTAEASLASIEAFLSQKGPQVVEQYAWLKSIAINGMVGVRSYIPDVRTGFPPTIYIISKAVDTFAKQGLSQVFKPEEKALIDFAKNILRKMLSDALNSPKSRELCDKNGFLDDLKKRLNKSIPVAEVEQNDPLRGPACDILGCPWETPLFVDPTNNNLFAMPIN